MDNCYCVLGARTLFHETEHGTVRGQQKNTSMFTYTTTDMKIGTVTRHAEPWLLKQSVAPSFYLRMDMSYVKMGRAHSFLTQL